LLLLSFDLAVQVCERRHHRRVRIDIVGALMTLHQLASRQGFRGPTARCDAVAAFVREVTGGIVEASLHADRYPNAEQDSDFGVFVLAWKITQWRHRGRYMSTIQRHNKFEIP
jgi:hypothetical protein